MKTYLLVDLYYFILSINSFSNCATFPFPRNSGGGEEGRESSSSLASIGYQEKICLKEN